ncbi:MAG: hypothetical protein Q9205_006886 [Flavoplaca limonia]
MEPFGNTLSEYLCPRRDCIATPVNFTVPGVFPTQIKYCVGMKCLHIATVVLQQDATLGSTQLYQISEPVLHYIALILSAISVVTVTCAMWMLHHYALGQKVGWSRKIGPDRPERPTDRPVRKSDAALAVNDIDKKWISSLHGPPRSTRGHFQDDRCSPNAMGVAVDPIVSRTPSPRTASSASDGPLPPSCTPTAASQGTTQKVHLSVEDPKPQPSVGVFPESKRLLWNSAAPTYARTSAKADHVNSDPPNTNSGQIRGAFTRHPEPDALLKKKLDGEHLTHSEKRHLDRYKSGAGSGPPPQRYNREGLLLKKENKLMKLTPGERKFLKRTRPEAGYATASATWDSDISAVTDGSTVGIPFSELDLDQEDSSQRMG